MLYYYNNIYIIFEVHNLGTWFKIKKKSIKTVVGLWGQAVCTQILALPMTHCVTLSKVFKNFVPQSLSCKKRHTQKQYLPCGVAVTGGCYNLAQCRWP